jgi:hypothetical protein
MRDAPPDSGLQALHCFRVNLFGFRVVVQRELAAREGAALLGRKWKRAAWADPDLVVRFARRLPQPRACPGEVITGRGFQLRPKQRVAYLVARRGGTIEERRRAFVRAAVFMFHLLDEMGRLGGRRRVVGLHASAVATPRGALVFCGHSGYGKSTIAGKLLRRRRLLADDWTTLLWTRGAGRDKARLLCCDVPGYVRQVFRGSGRTTPRSVTPRVAGLFWLAQGAQARLTPLSRAGAAARLLTPVQAGVSPATVGRRLRLLKEVLRRAPCRRLEFRREGRSLAALLKQSGLV